MHKILKTLLFFFLFIFIAILSCGITVFVLERKKSFVEIPDLYGKDIISAREILKRKRLKINESYSYHKRIPKDYVISQTPQPNEKVKSWTKVDIVISQGMPSVSIPRIIGKDLFSCKIILSEKAIALGNITYIYSDKPKDTVLAFSTSGKEIKEGDKINLLVSRGKRPISFLMPNLLGLSFEVASSTLESFNLVLGNVTFEPGTENIVLKQNPLPGVKVKEREKVDITLGIE